MTRQCYAQVQYAFDSFYICYKDLNAGTVGGDTLRTERGRDTYIHMERDLAPHGQALAHLQLDHV